MALFIMAFDKCPKCGEYGVADVHHDWVGEACIKCDYKKRDEKATARMIKRNREFMDWYKRKNK